MNRTDNLTQTFLKTRWTGVFLFIVNPFVAGVMLGIPSTLFAYAGWFLIAFTALPLIATFLVGWYRCSNCGGKYGVCKHTKTTHTGDI